MPKLAYARQREQSNIAHFPARATQTSHRSSNRELAELISGVLNHPECPTGLYNAMVDELSSLEVPKGFFDSSEYLEQLLNFAEVA